MQMTAEAAEEGPRRRVLLKLSGEAFAGGGGLGVDPDVVHAIAREIATVVRGGTEVAIVIGGGNFFRGAELQQRGMDRARSDYMGMLGTVMNCLALQDFLMKEGIETRVQTAITMGQVAEPYLPLRAVRHLERPQDQPGRGQVRHPGILRGDRAGPQGRGPHGHHALQGQ